MSNSVFTKDLTISSPYPSAFPSLPPFGIRELEAWTPDTRHISSVYVLEDSVEYHIQLSSTPLAITELFITAEQVGLAPISSTNTVQMEIMQEFASVMMEQRCNSHQGFERCQDRWLHQFNQGPSTNPEHVLSLLQFKEKGHRWFNSPF